jgi:hypothetical protein
MECDKKNKKIMKSSSIKDVIVKINNTEHLVEVDSNLFDDIFVEAATRVVEKYKKNMPFFHKLKVVVDCREGKQLKVKPKVSYSLNMYFILINAGLYSIAELLREKTNELYKIDLIKEPISSINIENE